MQGPLSVKILTFLWTITSAAALAKGYSQACTTEIGLKTLPPLEADDATLTPPLTSSPTINNRNRLVHMVHLRHRVILTVLSAVALRTGARRHHRYHHLDAPSALHVPHLPRV